MRKGNHVKRAPVAPQWEDTPDHVLELCYNHELPDGQLSDRNEKPRPEKIEFVVHPGGAIANLVGSGNAIAAGGSLPRKASADRREINLSTYLRFAQTTEFRKPSEERAARRPGKWARQDGLLHSWCLPDEHDFAQDRPAGHRRRQHARAAAALTQRGDMFIKLKL